MAVSLALTITGGGYPSPAPTATPTPQGNPTVVGAGLMLEPVAHPRRPEPRTDVLVIHAAPKIRTFSVARKSAPRAVVRQAPRSTGPCSATCQWAKTASVWVKYPAWVQTFALCASHHESWSGHMWTAENPTSTASGGFQWLDGSWQSSLRAAGLRGPGHAAYASPVLQAEVTAYVIAHHGQRNWSGSHCGYGT